MGIGVRNIVILGYEVSHEDYVENGGYDELGDFGYLNSTKGDLSIIAPEPEREFACVGYLMAKSNDSRSSGESDFY